VSIVLFIVVGTFGMMMSTLTTVFFPGVDANVAGQFYSNNSVSAAINSGLANEITEKMRQYPDTGVYGAGTDFYSFSAAVPDDMLAPKAREALEHSLEAGGKEHRISAVFIVLDEKNYADICRLAGVPPGSNILVNQYTLYQNGGQSIFAPLVFSNRALKFTNVYNGDEFDLTLHGVLSIGEIADEILQVSGSMVSVIVPELDALTYTWFAKTSDAAGFTEYAEKLLQDMFIFDDGLGSVNVLNIEATQNATRDLARLIMVFIYGFIAMLTLIGLTNVISTISANIRSRSREFAVLRSVGMAPEGLSRMLNLESVLCSAKSLIIGVPLGIIGSYIIYVFLASPAEFGFPVSWLPVLQCSLGVFVITWVTMRYAASRLRGKNIIDAIRTESGL